MIKKKIYTHLLKCVFLDRVGPDVFHFSEFKSKSMVFLDRVGTYVFYFFSKFKCKSSSQVNFVGDCSCVIWFIYGLDILIHLFRSIHME